MKFVENLAKLLLIIFGLLIVLFVGFIISMAAHERAISRELLNAPFAQKDTFWQSEDGIVTMTVGNIPVQEPLDYCAPVRGLTGYDTETKILYQGEYRPTMFSVDYKQQSFYFTVYGEKIAPEDVLFTASGHYKMKDDSLTLSDIRCEADGVFNGEPFVIWKDTAK